MQLLYHFTDFYETKTYLQTETVLINSAYFVFQWAESIFDEHFSLTSLSETTYISHILTFLKWMYFRLYDWIYKFTFIFVQKGLSTYLPISIGSGPILDVENMTRPNFLFLSRGQFQTLESRFESLIYSLIQYPPMKYF